MLFIIKVIVNTYIEANGRSLRRAETFESVVEENPYIIWMPFEKH